ncbi:hypothetical protein HUU05_09320 [candidate division KSB1 bacterium]|nr:hypothetical protein [candidate division KSB1 bacterium]
MAESKLSSISKADSLEKIGEFWDTHDFTDFDSGGPDVEFEFACAVPIESGLYTSVEKIARLRGVRIETLVNLWLQQRVMEEAQAQAA